MQEILKLNEISPLVKDVYKDDYVLTDAPKAPIAAMVRSFKMHDYSLPDTVLCVGRAGAGTNNIPVGDYAEKGVVVFNTPGANANAVKELVLASLLLSSRAICQGVAWSNGLSDGEKTVAEQVEKGKKAFGGYEIYGKTLGIYGLGAIGRKVAESAAALGMNIVGYDPYLSDEAAKTLTMVTVLSSEEELFATSDYITFHIPLTAETKGLVNAKSIAHMKKGVKLINLSRGEIVDNEAIISATAAKTVGAYVTDFPNAEIVNKVGILCIPHLGASTEEAEDNCAVMAACEIVDYVENGNVTNSVNFPAIKIDRNGARTVVLFKGSVKDDISRIISTISVNAVNSREKNGFGVCIIDTATALDGKLVEAIKAINGVVKLRQI